jgi:serine phosphatase RsbU (regulator of sigma subunit)
MYTDGVTEAMNWEQKLYGEERLLEVIAESGSGNIEGIISKTLD